MQLDWTHLVVTPIFAAIVGFLVWYVRSQIEALRQAQERLHADRRKVYAEVLNPVIRVFAGIKNPKESQRGLKQIASYDYRHAAFELTLVGSDRVVRAFNDMMQYLYRFDTDAGEQADAMELMRFWGSLLLEIRKSVGNPNTDLSWTDMLRPHITDIDSFVETR